MRRSMLGGLFAAAAVVVLALAMGASNAVAKTSKCMVINDRIDTTYLWTLEQPQPVQAAIDAADPGDTLWIRGECHGPLVITKSLTLTGQQPNGVEVAPTINAWDYVTVHSVVHVIGDDVQVQMNSLTLTGGGNLVHRVPYGGGIWNDGGQVTLNNVTITYNFADYGGGIFNHKGILTVSNSTIYANFGFYGGGIESQGGTIDLIDSEISDNTTRSGGGIMTNPLEFPDDVYTGYESMYPSLATVHLTDTQIDNNRAMGPGGGIYARKANVTLDGTSELAANTASGGGGGAYVAPLSTLTLADSATIHDNSGGGIWAYSASNLSNCVAGTEGDPGVNVYNNIPDNISGY